MPFRDECADAQRDRLVVDDAAFMRKLLSDALPSGGHEIVGEAGNGTEAVERYQQLRPELTTLDITMPELNGIEAARRIQKVSPSGTLLKAELPTDA